MPPEELELLGGLDEVAGALEVEGELEVAGGVAEVEGAAAVLEVVSGTAAVMSALLASVSPALGGVHGVTAATIAPSATLRARAMSPGLKSM